MTAEDLLTLLVFMKDKGVSLKELDIRKFEVDDSFWTQWKTAWVNGRPVEPAEIQCEATHSIQTEV